MTKDKDIKNTEYDCTLNLLGELIFIDRDGKEINPTFITQEILQAIIDKKQSFIQQLQEQAESSRPKRARRDAATGDELQQSADILKKLRQLRETRIFEEAVAGHKGHVRTTLLRIGKKGKAYTIPNTPPHTSKPKGKPILEPIDKDKLSKAGLASSKERHGKRGISYNLDNVSKFDPLKKGKGKE